MQLLRDRLEDFPLATGVEVATIDSFQGREADAVIISMVSFNVADIFKIKWPNAAHLISSWSLF